MQAWAAPYLPLIICSAGAALLAGIWLSASGALAADAPSSAPARGEQLLQLTPLLAAPLIGALWLFAPVRAHAVDLASSLQLLSTQSMQVDPDSSVRRAACRAVLTNPQNADQKQLLHVFSDSPELRRDCLTPALRAETPLASWIATNMVAQWEQSFDDMDALSSQEACQLAEKLTDIGRPSDRLRLLLLALNTTQSDQASCFDPLLGDISNLSELLSASDIHTESTIQAMLTPLVERVFFDAEAASRGWNSPPNQRALWSRVCESSSRGKPADQTRARALLKPLTLQLSCDWPKEISADSFNALNWGEVCADLEDTLATSARAEDLCPLINPHLVEAAISRAKALVAISAARYAADADAERISTTSIASGQPGGSGGRKIAGGHHFRHTTTFRADLKKQREALKEDAERQDCDGPRRAVLTKLATSLFEGDERDLALQKFDSIDLDNLECGPSNFEQIADFVQKLDGPEPLSIDRLMDQEYLERELGPQGAKRLLNKVARQARGD